MKKDTLKKLTPFAIDILILVGFFASLSLTDGFEFLSSVIVPYAPAVIMIILFLFYSAFYYFMHTADDVRGQVAKTWSIRNRVGGKWAQFFFRSVWGTVLFVFGMVHFVVYIVVLVFGSVNEDLVVDWAGTVMLVIMLVSITVFAIQYAYLSGGYDNPVVDKEKARNRMANSLPKRPGLQAVLFGLSSVILPIYTLWTYVSFVSDVPYKTKKDRVGPRTHQQLFRWMEVLFGFIILAILHFEVTVPSADYSGFTPGRALMLFIFLYLPLKLMVIIANKHRSKFIIEVIWAGLFFITQLLILYQFI